LNAASPPTTARINSYIRKTLYLLHSKPPNLSQNNDDQHNSNSKNNTDVDQSIRITEHDEALNNYSRRGTTIFVMIDLRLQRWLYIITVLKALQHIKKSIIKMKHTLLLLR